ncbi:MAG: glycosyltransferase [Thiohalospira sp.]
MKTNNVLVAPLNWGLGHATRVIPIIDRLIKNNFSVIIAGDGMALDFLKKEYPKLKCIKLPDVNIVYSKKHVFFRIFLQIPKIILNTIIEHYRIKSIIKKYQVDVIISDNRFGLWNKGTINILIIHQLRLALPKKLSLLKPIYPTILKKIVKNFKMCWIPDFSGDFNLSGCLSHDVNKIHNKHFIGVISRFERYLSETKSDKKYDLLFILSGPEPQRTIFEKIILNQIKNKSLRIALVRGITDKEKIDTRADVFGVLTAKRLFYLIQQSKQIICRAGYSSIMDMYIAQAQAILVPTPGQTEQEYLAAYLKQKKYFYSVSQQKFNLESAIKESEGYVPPEYNGGNNLLDEEVSKLKLLLQ